MQPVTILIVDDSRTARLALRKVLESDPDIQIVGEAANRREATAQIERLDPDLVTMDVCLPSDDGIEITATIMQTLPRPILVVTSLNPSDPDVVYRAIQAGALDVWPKPPPPGDARYAADRHRLVRLVKALATVPVVHRTGRYDADAKGTSKNMARIEPQRLKESGEGERTKMIAIGASTGGPPIVCSILERLPAPFHRPITIVQHMAIGFMDGFARWLAESSGHRIVVVRDQAVCIEAGTVYLAGDDRHIEFPSNKLISPSSAPERRSHRPSANVLFESAASRFGPDAIGVLLTGMGDDGADGLLALRRGGALTIAQEPSTCAVDAMPSSAIALRAAQIIARPEEIPTFLAARS